MQLFYNSELQTTDQKIVFDKKESGHIIKSLRKKAGDTLKITNGKGDLFTAKISDENSNKCRGKIVDHQYFEKPKYYSHVVVAPTKRNERFEWFLEKATEIGIDKITPIICDRSERKKIKLKRYQRVLQSAMKQSLQFHLPKLEDPITFKVFIQSNFTNNCYIAHCEENKERKLLKNELQKEKYSTILIGPEGDFSEEEIQQALAKNFRPVSLGTNRLRTETAALSACHTIALINQ